MRHAILAVVGLPLSLLAFAWAARAQSFDIIQVGDGVYAAIGRPGVFSNGLYGEQR
jgi:hypothetical protein